MKLFFIYERKDNMATLRTETKPKMRTLIAKQTDIPGVFHIATSENPTWNEINEEIVKATIQRINWQEIEMKS